MSTLSPEVGRISSQVQICIVLCSMGEKRIGKYTATLLPPTGLEQMLMHPGPSQLQRDAMHMSLLQLQITLILVTVSCGFH